MRLNLFLESIRTALTCSYWGLQVPPHIYTHLSLLIIHTVTIFSLILHTGPACVRIRTGMRLLSDERQKALWDAIAANEEIRALPVPVLRDNMRTIDGKVEAYYAVLAANFIAGRIDTTLM